MSQTIEVIFDGAVFRPTQSVNLKPNTKMEITISDERRNWLEFSSRQLENAFDDDAEPEYPSEVLKEKNPEYEGS